MMGKIAVYSTVVKQLQYYQVWLYLLIKMFWL